MIRLLILGILFCGFLNAHTISINDDFVKGLYSGPTLIYTNKGVDENIEAVRSKAFESIAKVNFSKSKQIRWTKFKIKNLSFTDKTIYLQNIRSGTDFIDVYIFKRDQLVKQFYLGDLREQNSKDILSRKSTFFHTFKGNNEYEIYIKYQSLGAISNQWELFSQQAFFDYQTKDSLIWGFIAGIILAIITYNLIAFYLTKSSTFLFYIISSTSSLIFLLSLNGVLYQLNLGLNLKLITISTWISAYSYLLFMFLFILKFFNESRNSKLFMMIKIFIYLLIGIIVMFMYCLYDSNYVYIVSKVDVLITLFSFIILFIALYKFRFYKHDTLFFLIGQFIYLSSFTYYIFEVTGMVPMSNYSWVILPFGFIIELICISIALNIKLKLVEIQKNNYERVLLEQSRFTNASKTLSYIIHQLKKPIALLGSQINLIEATLLFDEKELPSVVKKTLPKTKQTFDYINEINSSVSTLYLNPNGKETFNLKEQIEKLLLIQSDFFCENNIDVKANLESLQINTFKGTLSNVLMIIIENAIQALLNKENEKIVTISCSEIKRGCQITIEDNAGGIKNFSKIFDINYSTKGNKGSGIGLALAHTLTIKKLEGTIGVSNTKFGAKFVIKIFNSNS